MTTERDKCGLSSLLPMSCRGRAEAFARRLHSRLTSLGSEDGNGSADESSWLAAHENSIALAQPIRHTDTEMYLDFGLLESPGSPEDDITETELHKLLNTDSLKHSHSEDCHCPKAKERKNNLLNHLVEKSNDSDSSDGPFYDTENDLAEQRLTNGYRNSEANRSSDGETEKDSASPELSNQTEDSFATMSDGTHLPSNLSETDSTLSLKDEDYPSLEMNGCSELTINGDNEEENQVPQHEHTNGIDKNHIDYTKTNGFVPNHCSSSDVETETYVSSLSVDKDLTVECPSNGISEENIEIQINDDSEEERIPRVRRCSSLKTGKTPPGTPGRKKIVRFADVLGLDLADVRTFLDEIPKIPTSAYEDLTDVDLNDGSSANLNPLKYHGIKSDKLLVPLFQQPGGLVNFLDLVRDNLVCLENALVDDPMTFSIKGSVRVRNLDFHKSVHIRYTLNSWKTYADVQATYAENSCDGFSDKFTFIIYAHTLSVGQRLEFAVRFQCKGCQYWDSNKGANYCFQCLPATNNTPYTPITSGDDWGASFYY